MVFTMRVVKMFIPSKSCIKMLPNHLLGRGMDGVTMQNFFLFTTIMAGIINSKQTVKIIFAIF